MTSSQRTQQLNVIYNIQKRRLASTVMDLTSTSCGIFRKNLNQAQTVSRLTKL